jgi:hypothetical protein
MSRRLQPSTTAAPRPDAKSGQALLESFGIIVLLCLILFGMVQVVLMLTAHEVVQYSADASVRARAVGFNPFMVRKVNRVTTIPTAGRMISPLPMSTSYDDVWAGESAGGAFDRAVSENPSSDQFWAIERPTIPIYLGTVHENQLDSILNYEAWESLPLPAYTSSGQDLVGVTIQQRYALRMPLLRAFSDSDSITVRKESILADHAELYLE